MPDPSNAPRHSARLIRLAIFLWFGVALLISGLGFWGTQKQHQGWIAPQAKETHPGNSFVYRAELESENELFRGNDLFAVHSPRIVNQSSEVLASQAWDPQNLKGFVQFQSRDMLANDAKLPVEYSISIRWGKLIPLGICTLGVLALVVGISNWRRDSEFVFRPAQAQPLQWSLVIAILAFLSFIVLNPVWKFGDNAFIIRSTVQGDFLQTMIYPATGRFYPLGLIDLNLLIPFGDSPLAYLIERALMFLGLTALIFGFAKKQVGVFVAAALTLAFLASPGLFQVYSDAIYPEALLSLMLAGFFVSYRHVEQSGSVAASLLACFCATFATYCKEPVFGLLIVFALVQSVFAMRVRRTTWLDAYLLLNGVVFFAIYWWTCGQGGSYADLRNAGSEVTRIDSLMSLFSSHLCFIVSSLLAAWRLMRLVHQSISNRGSIDRNSLFFDGALFAGCAYTGAYAFVRLTADYYIIPAYVCWAFAYAGYIGQLWSQAREALPERESRPTPPAKNRLGVALCAIAIVIIFQSPSVIDSIRRIHTERANSQLIRNTIEGLKNNGYQLYVYDPVNAPAHLSFMQNYRGQVLQSFELIDGAPVDSSREAFKTIGSEPGIPDSKWIILHDPANPLDSLNRQLGTGRRFQPIYSLPNVLGARLFSVSTEQESVNRLAKTAIESKRF